GLRGGRAAARAAAPAHPGAGPSRIPLGAPDPVAHRGRPRARRPRPSPPPGASGAVTRIPWRALGSLLVLGPTPPAAGPAEMGDLQRDIVRLEGQRSGQEDALAQRLRTMYRLQVQGGALPVLLSGDDPIAQAVRLRHLATLATVDARMIREYRVTSEGLADRKDRLEARRKEMSALRVEAEGERGAAAREAAKV